MDEDAEAAAGTNPPSAAQDPAAPTARPPGGETPPEQPPSAPTPAPSTPVPLASLPTTAEPVSAPRPTTPELPVPEPATPVQPTTGPAWPLRFPPPPPAGPTYGPPGHGVAVQGGPGRRRGPRWWVWVAGLLAFVLVVVATVVTTTALLPKSDRAIVVDATKDLAALEAVTYRGVVLALDDVVTYVEITVTRDGEAQGKLTRDFGAQAEIVTDGTRTVLRGNVAWWLSDEPGSAENLADEWVLDPSDVVTGLFPTSLLTPQAVAGQASGTGTGTSTGTGTGTGTGTATSTGTGTATSTDWTKVGERSVDGVAGIVLSDGTREIVVSDDDDHRVLSVSIPVDTPPPPGGARQPTASFTVSEPDASERGRVSQAAANLRNNRLAPTAVPLNEQVTVQPSVAVTVSSPFCTTPTCPGSATVMNQGTETVVGQLTVTENGALRGTFPFTVPSGDTQEFSFTGPNLAPPGQTITTWIMATAYVPAVMGDDPDLVLRLAERGFDPGQAVVEGQPNGAPLLAALDALTTGLDPAVDQAALDTAATVLISAVNTRNFAPLHALVTSGNLVNPEGLATFVPTTGTVGPRRQLEEAAALAAAGDKVVLEGSYVVPESGVTVAGDVVRVLGADGRTGEVIQLKTVTGGIGKVVDNLAEAADQLDGTAEPAPRGSGFDRVAQLNLEPTAAGGAAAGADRAAVLDLLRGARASTPGRPQQTFYDACAPGGVPRVDKVIVVVRGGTGGAASRFEFTCADFAPQPGAPAD